MRQRMVVQPFAQLDIEDAAAWYEGQSTGLGTCFVNDLGDLLARIGAKPECYSLVVGEVRRSLMKRFPYAVYFAIGADRVAVLAALHQSRGLSLWNSTVNFLREPLHALWPASSRKGDEAAD